FINRLADLMNTSLSSARLHAEADLVRATIAEEVPLHYARWGGDLASYEQHAHGLIPEFANVRAGHVRDHVLRAFGLPHTVALDLEAFPPGAGSIVLNTIEPGLPFHGVYFNGNAIDLTALPEEGW